MTAYPNINGEHADTSKHLVTNILRKEWGFDRVAMSDWGGLNDTIKSIHAGTNLEMPWPSLRYGKALMAAVNSGSATERDHLNPSIRRVPELLDRAKILPKNYNLLSAGSVASSQRSPEPGSSTSTKIDATERMTDRPEFR
jgi:beta-glucosidase